jgi:hypothetical protein
LGGGAFIPHIYILTDGLYFNGDKTMENGTGEFDAKAELARKIYECYRFLAENAGSEFLRQKIDALAEEHLLSLQC